MPRHIIHKQKIVIKTGMRAETFKLQDRVSNLLKNDLTKKLDRLFNDVAPGDKILRIDKLELDLGTIGEQNLEAEFSRKLIDRLAAILTSQHVNKSVAQTELFEIMQEQSMSDALIYFLNHGSMPWYKAIKNLAEFESEIFRSFSEKEWQRLVKALKNDFTVNKNIPERLAIQFSDAFLEKILFLLYPGFREEDWHRLYDTSYEVTENRFVHAGYTKRKLRSTIWQAGLITALKTENKNDFIRKFSEKINRYADDVFPDEKESKEAALRDDKTRNLKRKGTESKIKPKIEENGEEFFVTNSGVVILHPFLQEYFKELGLVEKVFKNTESQHRAVLLMHYLASGETEVAEFNLILEKLLCAVDFDEPVPNHIELSEKEKEESDNLLRSVTEHWAPLRRTSLQGLRTSFFQREGKLFRAEAGWILKVEQKTIDILLDKLPWGIGTIKLPWMDTVLNVEWC